MAFETGAGMMDKVFDFDGLKVYVDATSLNCIWAARRSITWRRWKAQASSSKIRT